MGTQIIEENVTQVSRSAPVDGVAQDRLQFARFCAILGP